MNNYVKVFGAALEASDFALTIQMKLAYLNRLANGLVEKSDFLDPYDGFLNLSRILKKGFFKKVGKFPIESWLTPKPKLKDIQLINQINFQNFTNEGKLKIYYEKLKEFVQKEIFPDIPLMIGVDHSLTGGVLSAISQEVKNENLLVIIFDAHFDGLPASIAIKIAKYVNENPDMANPLTSMINPIIFSDLNLKDNYSCASFLYYLINQNIILPENLIIFGCQDYPNEKYRTIKNTRIIEYVAFFDELEQMGVNFIPISEPDKMIKNLNQILKKVNIKNLYLSLDVDVCALKEVIASRFRNVIGVDKSTIISAIQIIASFLNSKKVEIKGLDIMEIDTYLLNRFFPKSNRKDQTVEVIDDYLETLFSNQYF